MSRGALRVLLVLALALGAASAAAEEAPAAQRDLLLVARSDVPLAARLAATARVLGLPGPLDADLALRAGTALLPAAEEAAGWLILRALDDGGADPRWVAQGAGAVAAALEGGVADPQRAARLHALGMLLGHRPPGAPEALTAAWPLPDFVRAVLRREVGGLRDASGRPALESDPEGLATLLRESRAAAALLDDASADEPARMRRGLDGLCALGSAAVPLLLHEAELGVAGVPPGRMPRVARAVLALGFLEDRRATPVLARALASSDGWVRVAAATALGDLGDPAGAVALAVHCATLGDPFRPRDQWDWPGASDTNVPQDEWPRVDYFVVDVAAADSLLRLGAAPAAGYLIHEKLDPSRANFRIRVFQDAVDALRRALPALGVDAPRSGYNVDAGLPQRDAAFSRLAFAWHGMRDDPDVLGVHVDEQDAGFRRAARELAERLRGTDVRTFMITKPACALLGRCMTPTLIETLGAATRGSAVAELAETLGLVRDPRAIDTLLGLLQDERDFVRARAAEALTTYVDGRPRVRDALLALLEDARGGPRVSALKALVAARPDPAVLAAVEAQPEGRRSKDWRMAETALRLVQEGERHWPAIRAGLESEHRYEREAWWRHLRTALDWPEHLHDAKVRPGTPQARRVTEEQVLARLAERRAP